jgi:hypothetical protein
MLKALPDIYINAFSKQAGEQSIKYLALGKAHPLRLQLFDSENMLSV